MGDVSGTGDVRSPGVEEASFTDLRHHYRPEEQVSNVGKTNSGGT